MGGWSEYTLVSDGVPIYVFPTHGRSGWSGPYVPGQGVLAAIGKLTGRIAILLDVVSIAGFGYAVATVSSAFFAPSQIAIGQNDIVIFWRVVQVASAFHSSRALGKCKGSMGPLDLTMSTGIP